MFSVPLNAQFSIESNERYIVKRVIRNSHGVIN